MTRYESRIRRRKYGAKQIVEGEPHVGASRRSHGFLVSDALENELTENARCQRSAVPI
jgi:hypothetical protein